MAKGITDTSPFQALGGAPVGVTQVEGDVAHGTAESNTYNPVKIGGWASTALAAVVGEADRVRASFDLYGRLRALVGGDIAHDAPDAADTYPVKLGGWASAALAAAVGEADRVRASFDLLGRLRTLVSGDVAHDDPDLAATYPVKLGAVARLNQALPVAVAAGDRVNLSADEHGRLLVQGGALSQFDPGAEATNGVIKASAGLLYRLYGYKTNVAAEYIQLHNLAAAPGAGAVPVVSMLVPTTTWFSIDYMLSPRVFSTGITWALSSTGPTHTAVAGTTVWANAEYL